MKNKKGFTLVELLAVIVIMAILLMVAIPAVSRILEDVRKRTFVNEAKTIYNEAINKYISESAHGFEIKKISSEDDSAIEMNGEKLKYCVILDDKGKVSKLAVGNDRYYIMLDQVKDIESIKKGDVRLGKLQNMECTSEPEDFKPKVDCTYDGELKSGVVYKPEDQQYDYTYQSTGWAITLRDKNSTVPVNSKICSTVNGKPIISASQMFYNSKTTSIDLSSLDTSSITDMGFMFANTTGLTSLDLSNFDTSKVTNMSDMFLNSSAKKITGLDKFDTSNVKYMSKMFSNSKAESLDLSSFNTEKVTDMREMFKWCQAENVKGLENIKTSKVTDMQSMFEHSSMKSLNLASFDTKLVTNMKRMFYYSQATSISLPPLNAENVTTMEDMFRNSRALRIDGLGNFKTKKVTVLRSIFQECSAQSLDVSSFDTSNVVTMDRTFYNSEALEIKGLENFNTSKVTNMQNMFAYTRASNLNLSSFNTANVTNMQNMFEGNMATKLDLSSFNTSKVINMYEMFFICKANEIVGLNNFNTSRVTNMTRMFSGTSASTLDLSSFDTSKVVSRNMTSMFSNSLATTGYARTQAEADKFNATTGKPSTLTFKVK